MLKDSLNGQLALAMKINNRIGVTVLRDIKTAIMNWETAKENVGKTFTFVDEVRILKKLQSQYKETANLCNDGKHYDLVNDSLLQAAYIEQFLPEEVSEREIRACIESSGIAFDKKNMGALIKYVKGQYSTADGKLVSEIVKTYLA